MEDKNPSKGGGIRTVKSKGIEQTAVITRMETKNFMIDFNHKMKKRGEKNGVEPAPFWNTMLS
jgi:hypothetical protein